MQITRTGLLAAALMGGLTLTACGHPSDVSMEKRFVTHESDFNQLLAMSKEDLRVARIPAENRNDVMKPAALTEQRWENYRSRFQKTGLSGGIDRSPDYPGATFVIASYSGIGIKGYAFSDVPLSPLVASWMATYRQTWDRRHTGYLHSDTSKQIGISTTMNEPGDLSSPLLKGGN
ncbi:MAG TPA: hypothetical protein VGH17_08575 [Candidatus Acidoferrales bacterium]|jgi:hypothetical protein